MAGIILTLATVLCEISSHGQTLLGNDSKILENDTFATRDFHNVGKENVKSVARSVPHPSAGTSKRKAVSAHFRISPDCWWGKGEEWKRLLCIINLLDKNPEIHECGYAAQDLSRFSVFHLRFLVNCRQKVSALAGHDFVSDFYLNNSPEKIKKATPPKNTKPNSLMNAFCQ